MLWYDIYGGCGWGLSNIMMQYQARGLNHLRTSMTTFYLGIWRVKKCKTLSIKSKILRSRDDSLTGSTEIKIRILSSYQNDFIGPCVGGRELGGKYPANFYHQNMVLDTKVWTFNRIIYIYIYIILQLNFKTSRLSCTPNMIVEIERNTRNNVSVYTLQSLAEHIWYSLHWCLYSSLLPMTT